jgi:hypothetical protein
MKKMTGLTLLSIGAILSFAVNVHPWFISPQIVGLVLMLTGITGLCLNLRGTGWVQRQLEAIRQLLAQDAGLPGGDRVPLNDLLAPPAAGADHPARQPGGRAGSES